MTHTFSRYHIVGNYAERSGIRILCPDRDNGSLLGGAPHDGHVVLGGWENGPVVVDVLHVHFDHGTRAQSTYRA